MSKKCSVEGCEGKHYAKGYCRIHYWQMKKHGCITSNKLKNEIIEYDDYAEIILYGKDGNEKARTMIDLEYVDMVKQYRWCLANTGYPSNSQVGLLHRYIMNPPEGMVVDHINRNKLDNRRDNLRVCTQQENSFNTSVSRNNNSGTPGVSWNKERNKWVAHIQVNGKMKHLGIYKTKEEAIEARRQAEIEYFGEFAPTRE